VRGRFAALLLIGLAAAGCDRLPGRQAEDQANKAAAAPVKAAPLAPGTTPMNERVAVLGILNKRNGIARDIRLKPGQAVRIKDLIVRLRACETTPPWEFDPLTGAFVQVDVQQPDGGWSRVFGLAVQGKPVAQRGRTPRLRRLAQELHDGLPGGGGRSGSAVGRQQRVEQRPVGQRRHAGGAKSIAKQPNIGRTWDLHRAKGGKVIGQELTVAQGKVTDA
jgi:hypothetical protein